MKYTLKKIITSIAAVSVMSTQSFSFFGFDGTGIASEVTQIAGWAAQAERWATHLEKIKQEIALKSGIRDIIAFQREIKDLHEFMQNYSLDFMDLTNDIIDQPRSQVGQYAKRLFEQYNLFDDCNYDYMSEDQKRICKSEMVRNVQEISTYQYTSQRLKSIAEKLKDLSKQRAASKDIKQSADIANAIQMQLAQLEIIKIQMDMMEAQNRSKERVDRRQLMQISKQRQNKTFKF